MSEKFRDKFEEFCQIKLKSKFNQERESVLSGGANCVSKINSINMELNDKKPFKLQTIVFKDKIFEVIKGHVVNSGLK